MHIYSLVYVYACVCVCAYLVHICVRAIVASLCYLIMSTSMVILWHIYHVWHLCVKGYIYLFVYVNGLCVIWFRGISLSPCSPLVCCPRPPGGQPPSAAGSLYTTVFACKRLLYISFAASCVIYIFFYTWGCLCLFVFVCAHTCVYMIPGTRYTYCIISIIY